MQSIFVLLAAFAAITSAAPTSLPSSLHEKRASLPRNLRRTARVDGEAILPLRIALTQSNLEHAYDHLLDVSRPSSPRYGQHWTAKQVHEAFAPDETSLQAVTDWLQSAGIPLEEISSRRGWIAIDVPTSQAEKLFSAEYYEHENVDGMTRIGCDSYHVPTYLTRHIDYIKPGVVFSPPVERTLRKRGLSEETALSALTEVYASEIQNLTASYLELIANMTSGNKEQMLEQAGTLFNDTQTCGAFITPACIRALYNIPENNYSDSVNTLGLYESEYQLWDQQDLDSFFATVLPNAANGTHPLVTSINNATSEGPTGLAGGEVILDLDIAYSLIYPQSVRIFQSQGTAEINKTYYSDYAGYEALFDAIDGSYCDPSKGDAGADCGTANLTRVFSSSYGVPEIELPEKASQRMCNEVMKLTLQGHTFLASSGDYGVASHPQENTTGCISPDNPQSTTQNGTVFNPQSLDSCPYVLSCGATQVNANETVSDLESAAVYASEDNALHQGSTGGGFSNYFAQPSYQSAAVATYFSDYDPGYASYNYTGYSSIGANGGKYNRAGRGFPDVSANGNNFLLFVANQVGYSGGTSMSTPLWGSVLTLVNQERTKVGKGPVGFVNPVLYEHPEIFNDITKGSNPGCGTAGFTAVPGWDPLTGLGTPDYPKLLEVFLNLP